MKRNVFNKTDYLQISQFVMAAFTTNKNLIYLGLMLLLCVRCKNLLDSRSSSNGPGAGPLSKPILVSPPDKAEKQTTKPSLIWQKVTGATSYRVQLAGNSGFDSLLVDSTTDSTSMTIIGLRYDSTYDWKVKAISGSVESSWSSPRSFKTMAKSDAANIRQVTLINPKNDSTGASTTIMFNWSSVNNATGYELQLSAQSDFSTTVTDTVTQSTSDTAGGLKYGTKYYWRVKPKVSSGAPMWSGTWNFTTEATPGAAATLNKPVTAYLQSKFYYVPGNSGGNMPTGAIDWSAISQLIYFAVTVNSNGSLSAIAAGQNVSPSRIKAIVSAAHQHNTPVLITIGGWGDYNGFSSAIRPSNRAALVKNIVSILVKWGFDGIDLDLEPIKKPDISNFTLFTKALYSALQAHSTPLLSKPRLVAAVKWQPDMFSNLQSYFNQLNVMTYNFSGAWPKWVTWYNSPLSNHGLSFPDTTEQLPSAAGLLQKFIQAGVSKKRMRIGVDFSGYVWSGGSGTSTGGVTKPYQSWQIAPNVQGDVPYYVIMNRYYKQNRYHWDSQAKVPYLSINQSGNSSDRFISYDNAQSIIDKISYAKQLGLGGVFIWGLATGYRKNMPAGQRDKLLQAVKNGVNQ